MKTDRTVYKSVLRRFFVSLKFMLEQDLGYFSYKAVDQSGEHITGSIEAPDHKSAVTVLAAGGQFVTEIIEKHKADKQAISTSGPSATRILQFGSRRIRSKDILAVTMQLSTALRAGLPLLNALEIIREQIQKPALKELLGELAGAVSSGKSLSEAMSTRRDVFSELQISMVQVGETGGILEQTTGQLAALLNRDEKLKTTMKNASAYPIFVLCIGLISVIVIVTWILPRILATIGGGLAALPLPTRVLLALSDFIRNYGIFTAVALTAGGFFLRRWVKTTGRIQWDYFKLKVPVLGSVLRTIAVGRFARTLGALTKGGVTLLEALTVVRNTLGNEVLGREIDKVVEDVKGGSALADSLGKSQRFPPLLVQIVSMGEQTGRLDELLLNAAQTFEEDADAAMTRFMAIFPAALIVLLALVVGFIIAATLLPILVMELQGVPL